MNHFILIELILYECRMKPPGVIRNDHGREQRVRCELVADQVVGGQAFGQGGSSWLVCLGFGWGFLGLQI